MIKVLVSIVLFVSSVMMVCYLQAPAEIDYQKKVRVAVVEAHKQRILKSQMFQDLQFESLWSWKNGQMHLNLVSREPFERKPGQWVFELKKSKEFYPACHEKASPVTAQSVKSILDRSAQGHYEIQVVDDLTFWVTPHPQVNMWKELADLPISRALSCQEQGTGSYIWDEASSSLKRMRVSERLPEVIELVTYPTYGQARSAFSNHDVDIVSVETECVTSDMQDMTSFRGRECLIADAETLQIDDHSFGFLWINTDESQGIPLDIRKALALSLSPDLLLKDSLAGLARDFPIQDLNLKNSFFRNHIDEAQIYAGSQKRALKLLWVEASRESRGQAQKLREEWLRAGLRVDIDFVNESEWKRRVQQHVFDLVLVRASYDDQSRGASALCSGGYDKGQSYADLCQALKRNQPLQEYQQNIQRLHAHLAENVAWVPLVIYQEKIMLHSHLKPFLASVFGGQLAH